MPTRAAELISTGLGLDQARSNTTNTPTAAEIEEKFRSKAIPLTNVGGLEFAVGQARATFDKFNAAMTREADELEADRQRINAQCDELQVADHVRRNKLTELARLRWAGDEKAGLVGAKTERAVEVKKLAASAEVARASRPLFASVVGYLNASTIDDPDRLQYSQMLSRSGPAALQTLAAKAAAEAHSKNEDGGVDGVARKRARALAMAILDRYDAQPEDVRKGHPISRNELAAQVLGAEYQRGVDAIHALSDFHSRALEMYSARSSGRRMPAAQSMISRGLAKRRAGRQ